MTASEHEKTHYSDVIIGAMASQITSVAIVYSTVYSGRSKKTSKLRVTGLCAGNSPATGEFPAQMASNAENVSIWWRHHNVHISWSKLYIAWGGGGSSVCKCMYMDGGMMMGVLSYAI